MTLEDRIKAKLGSKYDPSKKEYCVARHRDVVLREEAGWKRTGEIDDSTPDQNGTMVVMERKKDK